MYLPQAKEVKGYSEQKSNDPKELVHQSVPEVR